MALVKCSECGKEISNNAEVCPNCGCPTALGRENERRKKKDGEEKQRQITTSIIMVLSIILWCMSLYNLTQLSKWDIYVLQEYGRISDDMWKVILLFAISIGLDVGSIIGNVIIKRRRDRENGFQSLWTPPDFGASKSIWKCPSCNKTHSNDTDFCSCGYMKY